MKKKKTDGFFDMGIEKRRLSLMQEAREIRRKPKSKGKQIVERLVKEEKRKLSEDISIAKQEKKIKERKPIRKISEKLKEKLSKALDEKMVAKRILRKTPRATIAVPKTKLEQAKEIFFNEKNITFRGGV